MPPNHSLTKLLLENLTALLRPGDTLRLETSGIALFEHSVLVAIGLEAVAAHLTKRASEDNDSLINHTMNEGGNRC